MAGLATYGVWTTSFDASQPALPRPLCMSCEYYVGWSKRRSRNSFLFFGSSSRFLYVQIYSFLFVKNDGEKRNDHWGLHHTYLRE